MSESAEKLASNTRGGNKAVSLGIIIFAAIAAILAVFFLVPTSQPYVVPGQYGPAGFNTTIHTSLSCQMLGFGEVNIHGIGSEWSNNCNVPSHVHIPNPRHINATG